MFWNDPNLYGATFPYKDINTPVQPPIQTPFALTPFDQFRRFVPQPFGFVPQNYGWLPQGLPPQNYGFVPPYFNLPQSYDPMLHTRAMHPFVQPFGLQQALFNPYRPFIG